jgi:alkylation response protein AidB-like acyl-CoA dehydrogenase
MEPGAGPPFLREQPLERRMTSLVLEQSAGAPTGFSSASGQETRGRQAQDRDVHVVESDLEAIEIVRHLAASFRSDAASRDRAQLPHGSRMERLAQAGFFGMTVPKASGGAGVSTATVADAFRILAAADGGVSQAAQNHFCWLPAVANGTAEQAAFFFRRILAGDRIGYLRSGEQAPRRTEIRRGWGGWHVSGQKDCLPGAASADWLAFTAPFDVAGQRSCFVLLADAAARGVMPTGGRDGTGRGTVFFDDVFVPDSGVFPLQPSSAETPADARFFQLNAGLIHAAIALGLADAALADAGAYVRDLSLPWPGEEPAESPFVAGEWTRFDVVVRTAGALLRDDAHAVDQARTWPSAGTVLNARLAVADARLLCTDVANRISDEFFLLADICATLGAYGFDRHQRHARTHALNDPLQWWEYHLGSDGLSRQAQPANSCS